MGSFLAALRKANGYTQQEVADKLNVSNKTVSKWECDDGCPEIMMLPAIAELYSVTVDEILKGERIQKVTSEQEVQKEQKENTGKRVKYLVEKALTQYKNKSIIAITLSVVGAILPYFVSMIFGYDFIFIPIILTIALIAAATIIIVIATNNLKSNLYSQEFIDEETLKEVKQISIKYICLIIFFPIISLIGLAFIITGFDYMAFWFLPLSILVATAISYTTYKNQLKKENIEIVKSKENIVRRKKFIKRTVIIDIVIVLAFALGSAVVAYLNTQSETVFSFKDAVNYQYETLEEAEKDYYKIYNAIINEKPLYRLDSVDYDSLSVSGTTIYFVSTHEKNGAYQFIDFIEDESFDYNFKTKEELNNYIIENIYDEEKAFYLDFLRSSGRYITFDNDTLSITEHNNTMNNFVSEFFDTYNIDIFILSTFFVFGATIISLIIYFKKKN